MAGNVSGLSGEVRVEGLRELSRAFKHADKQLKVEMREMMQAVGEPVASKAQRFARENISHISHSGWWLMRIGVTESSVYVAPREHGSKIRTRQTRPNLKTLLLDKAMIPALEQEKANVEREFGFLLDHVGREWSTY